jgi:uncharacterized RmlC-like cupin family protein
MIPLNIPAKAMPMPSSSNHSAGTGALTSKSPVALLKRLLRRVFFEIFARVKAVDVLGPTVIREIPVDSPYQAWLRKVSTEIPIFGQENVDDVATLPLRPWPQMGQGVTGEYLRFQGHQIIDGRIVEIPAGGHTFGKRLFCEQDIYIIGGSGYTILQQEGKQEQRFSWGRGDLFSVPLNVRHMHFSNSGSSARMLIITSFPMILNLLGDEKFIFENPFVTADRYDGAADYFSPRENEEGLLVRTNLVRNIQGIRTRSFEYRGKGNTTFRPQMAGNRMLCAHVSEIPPKAYKKAHRQSGEAFVLVLSGAGYSLAWPEGAWYKKGRVNWNKGTLFSPPPYWYHQNFNPGPEPARYLAINTPTPVRNLGLRFSDQLEVDLEEVRREWEKELQMLL